MGSLPAACASSATKDCDREGVRDVRHRAEPADPDVRGRLAGLEPHVRDRERHVDQPIPISSGCSCFGSGLKVDMIGRRRAAVPPAADLVGGIQTGLDPLRRDGMIEAVLDVVLAGPDHLYRRAAHCLRQQCRFLRVVGLGLAPEAAAEERDVHRHVLGRHPEQLGDVVAGAVGALHHAHTSHLPSATTAVATGGSIGACARCGT